MRWAPLCAALLSMNCFNELPDLPKTTETGTAGTDSESTTSTADSATSASTASVSDSTSNETVTDMDMTEVEPDVLIDMYEGLYTCGVDEPCDVWELKLCDERCPALPNSAACVLDHMETHSDLARVFVTVCDGACEQTVYVIRGGGTPDVLTQTVTLDDEGEPVSYGAVRSCQLVDEAFFQTCAKSFDAPCMDMSLWVEGCAPLEDFTCPPW